MYYQNKELELYKEYYRICKEMQLLDNKPLSVSDKDRALLEEKYISLRTQILKVEKEINNLTSI